MPDDNPPYRKPLSVDLPCEDCNRPMVGIIRGPMQPPRTQCQSCEYQADAALKA